ncbi:MAG: sulfite exporter TauE/SafE family protein [Sedimentisphaerales bacterium]|nr:sulfite exporter TauE/SafE family protein [Sedimentisphaerales bacterium]
MQAIGLLVVGLAAGILSGLLGIGGGVLIIPALVWGFGLSQHMAQGTTLALMVPPIGLLAAWTYYRNGHVDLRIAVLVGLGFFIGGLVGARFAVRIDDLLLRRFFGVVMLAMAIKMILGR